MSNAGIGAMLHMLGGGSPKNPDDYYGKKILDAKFINNEILIIFDDGVKIKIWDDVQSCCEYRYITTDDKIESLVGQTLIEIRTKEVADQKTKYDEVHEIVFIEIQGSQSVVTFCTHNEHNGYYGGFGLSLDEVKNDR